MRLELHGITKSFGAVHANQDIDLIVEPGTVHCILGENGAGKSTLMNVLYGLLEPDAGEILLDGRDERFRGPRDAMRAGIGMVHQHFMLIPALTVAENVVLGQEPTRPRGWLDMRTARARVHAVAARFGFALDPDQRVAELSVGAQQRVELVKALARDASVLILDEPTAVLTPQEADELMTMIRDLATGGTSVVFISHKLREVKAIADRITVLRAGRVVGTAEPTASEADLAALMVGRPVELVVTKEAATPGDPQLVLDHVTVRGSDGRVAVDDVSLEVRAGEILAIAGVEGNGQSELMQAVYGARTLDAGTIRLGGERLDGGGVHSVLAAGVAVVPEDRTADGTVGSFTIAENLILDRLEESAFAALGFIREAAVAEFARERIDEFSVRASSTDAPISSLSGGNQQKVILARELTRTIRPLVAAQPTRGLDVGSIEYVHRRIVQTRDAGLPVIVTSTELDEVRALGDRIAVMFQGRVVGIVPPDVDAATIGQLMAGVIPQKMERTS
jgi:simple sugar transport system ATP-binding protein